MTDAKKLYDTAEKALKDSGDALTTLRGDTAGLQTALRDAKKERTDLKAELKRDGNFDAADYDPAAGPPDVPPPPAVGGATPSSGAPPSGGGAPSSGGGASGTGGGASGSGGGSPAP